MSQSPTPSWIELYTVNSWYSCQHMIVFFSSGPCSHDEFRSYKVIRTTLAWKAWLKTRAMFVRPCKGRHRHARVWVCKTLQRYTNNLKIKWISGPAKKSKQNISSTTSFSLSHSEKSMFLTRAEVCLYHSNSIYCNKAIFVWIKSYRSLSLLKRKFTELIFILYNKIYIV